MNTNIDSLLNDLVIAGKSASGLVTLHTDESDVIFQELEIKCDELKIGLRKWDRFSGYLMPKLEPSTDDQGRAAKLISWVKDPEFPKQNPSAEFMELDVLQYFTNEAKLKDGEKGLMFFYMQWPHWGIKQNARLIQGIYNLTQHCRTSHKTIILSVPTGFELPQELKEYSVNLYAEMPDRDSLKELVVGSIGDLNHDYGLRNDTKKKVIDYCDDDVYEHLVNNLTGLSNITAANTLNRALIAAKNLPVDKEKHLNELTDSLSKIRLEKIKSSGVLEVLKPEPLENIGGLENLKDYMSVRRNAFTKAAKDFGVKTPKGVLLIGPPGVGKSASAKAIGSVLGLDIIRFDVSRVFGSLVGQSEANAKAAVNMIKAVSPCVVLVDELDKVFNINSGGTDSGTTSRVLGDILTTMQESDKPIFWVFTANRVEGLPPELLRKGRLDDIFFVGLPNEVEREAILKIHLRKGKQSPEIKLTESIKASNNYVSSELECAVNMAILEAFNSKSKVTDELIAKCITASKPLSEQFSDRFTQMTEWAASNAIHASKDAKIYKSDKVDEPVKTRVGTRAKRVISG